MTKSTTSSVLKIFFTIIASALLALAALGLALPSILSTQWGQRRVESIINRNINGKLTLTDLDLHFWGKQQIAGVELRDKQDNKILTFDSLKLDDSIPALLINGVNSSHIEVEGLNAQIIVYGDGSNNLLRAISASPAQQSPQIGAPILLENVNADVNLGIPLVIKSTGSTLQGDLKGTFSSDILVSGIDRQQLMQLADHPEQLFEGNAHLNIKLDVENFPVELIDSFVSAKRPDLRGAILGLLGPKINLNVNQSMLDNTQGVQVQTQLASQNLKADFIAKIAPAQSGKQVAVDLNGAANYGGETVQVVLQTALDKDFQFKGEIPPTNLSLQRIPIGLIDRLAGLENRLVDFLGAYANLNFQSSEKQGATDFAFGFESEKISIPSLKVKLNKENHLEIKLSGNTHIANSPVGQLEAHVVVKDWMQAGKVNLTKAQLTAQANIKEMPTSFLEAIANNPQLSVVLGEKIDVEVNSTIALEGQPKGALRLKINGDQLEGTADLNFHNAITLNQPARLKMDMTPERFEALRKLMQGQSGQKDNLTLIEPMQVVVNVRELTIPIGPKALPRTSFDSTCTIDRLVVRDASTDQSLAIQNLQGQIKASDLQNQIAFQFNAKQVHPDAAPTDLTATGSVGKALDAHGSLNVKDLSVTLDSKITGLPIQLICRLVCLNPSTYDKIEALFGKSLDADVHVALQSMNGPVKAFVRGQNGTVNLDASLGNGILYLTTPFTAEFAVTPKLGRSLLQEVFPLLGGIVNADQPVKISIDNKGFAMPVRDFNIAQINIQNAMLSMGKVKFNNEGQLGQILSLLTPPDSELIVVWFTPLYINMRQGVLNLERIDMLVSNKFPIATWGNVNFVKDKVDLVIGLSGYAISHAFNLPGLEASDMLQIPLKGTTTSAGIDKRKAAAKISALVAQSRGSAQGMLLGTVLHIAGGGLSEGPVPAPTTNPLPWAGQMKAAAAPSEVRQTEDQPAPKKSKKKKVDAVQQEIQNQAGNLLNQFLR